MKDSAKPKRLPINAMRRIAEFTEYWVRCNGCERLAITTPNWGTRTCMCKCKSCGAVYSIPISGDHTRQFVDFPFWLKSNFRGKIFWAVNGEHLDLLEQVVGATLRERPIYFGRRISFTTMMPFNLPSWLLSAKNRPDILRIIKKLRKTIPPKTPKRAET
jgi:hypothetical protein